MGDDAAVKTHGTDSKNERKNDSKNNGKNDSKNETKNDSKNHKDVLPVGESEMDLFTDCTDDDEDMFLATRQLERSIEKEEEKDTKEIDVREGKLVRASCRNDKNDDEKFEKNDRIFKNNKNDQNDRNDK